MPLSRAKNSKLLNHAFDQRSMMEMDAAISMAPIVKLKLVSLQCVWDPNQIKQRGLNLLNFEKRWNIQLGDDSIKLKLLHVDFLTVDVLEESA